MTNKSPDTQAEIVEEFARFSTWEEKYKHLIQLGRSLPKFPEEFRTDQNKVTGCQSQVWLHAELDGQTVKLYADSDAMIVKGLIALLLRLYSGRTTREIIETQPDFIQEIGMDRHLSMNRSNGLAAMTKQIKLYALVFQSMG
ncbi:MAG: SufE family protein [Candidatus Caenarcaniphilales bacterium]|nr:SufE family protein [Candidatus Caenarcaniphilales bacterium]